MERIMLRRVLLSALGTGLAAVLSACGGGGSASSSGMQSGQLQMLIGDASAEDWSEIGVTVLSIALSVGYGSAEAFARAFKQRFGCSPTQWRNLDQGWTFMIVHSVLSKKAASF